MKFIMWVGGLSLALLKHFRSIYSQVAWCVSPFSVQYFKRRVLAISYMIDWKMFECIVLSCTVIPGSTWLSLNPLDIF